MTELVTVVLAAGVGSRMRAAAGSVVLTDAQLEAADHGQKAMMPIPTTGAAPRPFLDYVLSAVADAGATDVVVVVAPDDTLIRDRYQRVARPTRFAIDIAVQTSPRGTADAVLAAADAVGSREFLVVNGDNLYPASVLRALGGLAGPGVAVFEREDLVRSSNVTLDRVAAFALLDVSPDGVLTDVREKPSSADVDAAGPHAGVGMNAWRFDRRIFDACGDVGESPRGERELTAAVRVAIARGVVFRAVAARGPVLDVSTRADVAAVAARLAAIVPHL